MQRRYQDGRCTQGQQAQQTQQLQQSQYREDAEFSTPVVIVGAGPTGLMAANLLGKAGIQTLLIERNAGLSDCPRAISIDDEGLRICQAVGLSEAVMQHMLLDVKAQYLSNNTPLATISPSSTSRPNGYPPVSTFHQPTFEQMLLDSLERFPCVSIYFQHTLVSFEQDETGLSLLVHKADDTVLQIRCFYLLACDGGQSPVRHALHIPMKPPSLLPSSLSFVRKWGISLTSGAAEQRWLSIDCVNGEHFQDPMSRNTGYFFADWQRPSVSIPTPFNGRRWEFLVHPHEQPEQMLDDDTLHTLIQQTLSRNPRVVTLDNNVDHHAFVREQWRPQIIRRTFYTFHTSIAETFSQGRVFLLGDAAHLMPPFAGQGMNSGLRDVYNLCWKLQQVLQAQASPIILDSYGEERAPHAVQVTLLSSLPGEVLTTTRRHYAWLRDRLFLLLGHIPALRTSIRELRVKPPSRYLHGLTRLLAHTYSNNAVHSDYKKYNGTLLPQPRVATTDGCALLLDEVSGSRFALLHYCQNTWECERLRALVHYPVWKAANIQAIALLDERQATQVRLLETDITGIYYNEEMREQPFSLLRKHPHLCILVRPDHYILGIFDIRDGDALSSIGKFLNELLHVPVGKGSVSCTSSRGVVSGI